MRKRRCDKCGSILPQKKDSIGYRVYDLRKKKGWNQSDLANKIGVSRPSVANIEADNQNVTIAHLKKICKIFKVSMDYVVFGRK